MSRPTRYIAIDFGLARIGIAISDVTKLLATPFQTMKTEKKMEQTVDKLLLTLQKDQEERRYEIEEIIIGMPFLMSGKKGLMADEVHHFIELLKERFSAPVITWDERLTSVQAERTLREGEMSRKKRTKVIDQVAAVIILQNYLDHKGIGGFNETLPSF